MTIILELPNQDHLPSSKRKIVAQCSKCDKSRILRKDYYYSLIKNNNNICRSCAIKDACAHGTVGNFESRSKASKNKWKNKQFRNKITETSVIANTTDQYKQSQSDRTKKLWENNEYRNKVSDGVKNIMDDDMKAKISDKICQIWKNNNIREKYANARSKQLFHISNLQLKLYSYLDDLKIIYKKESSETVIGYYVFDCLIPKFGKMSNDLLIECQGDYWHKPEIENGADKRKFTYIERYFPEYEIMYLWEHEFATKDRIINRLKSKLGIDTEFVNFDFKNVDVRKITYSEASTFLDAYHYVGKGRGGIAIGAFLNDVLVGCIIYSSKLRQNQNFGKDFRELSRLCIHPSYQKKNFASWFITRTYQFLDVKLVISFCDTTAGHTGTVYKASNFKFSHETNPDYWYVDRDGFVMHKKTLYNKAINLKMTESEYAEKYYFSKKYGGKKLCFIREI